MCKSWLLLLPTCRNKFAALNPNQLKVFTAESQFWCLSDTALGLALRSDSLLAIALFFSRKTKFALVIKEAGTAGTEALMPLWANHLTFKSLPKLYACNSCKKPTLWLSVPVVSVILEADCVFVWVIFVSSLALAFSACLLVTQRGFTKVFVSGITDVTLSSREMTYFGSGLNLASQGNI